MQGLLGSIRRGAGYWELALYSTASGGRPFAVVRGPWSDVRVALLVVGLSAPILAEHRDVPELSLVRGEPANGGT